MKKYKLLSAEDVKERTGKKVVFVGHKQWDENHLEFYSVDEFVPKIEDDSMLYKSEDVLVRTKLGHYHVGYCRLIDEGWGDEDNYTIHWYVSGPDSYSIDDAESWSYLPN